MGGVTPHRIQFFTGRHACVMGGGTPHKQFALVTVYGGVPPTPYHCPSFTWLSRQPFHHLDPLAIHAFIIPNTFAKYTNYFQDLQPSSPPHNHIPYLPNTLPNSSNRGPHPPGHSPHKPKHLSHRFERIPSGRLPVPPTYHRNIIFTDTSIRFLVLLWVGGNPPINPCYGYPCYGGTPPHNPSLPG